MNNTPYSDKELYLKKYNYKELENTLGELFAILRIFNIDVDILRDINALMNYISVNNSLMQTNPTLANEWNYAKNGELTPNKVTHGSNKKVWWICENGHEWIASIGNRSKGRGCPYCSGKKKIQGESNLLEEYPRLHKLWDYQKNVNVDVSLLSKGSHKKFWRAIMI